MVATCTKHFFGKSEDAVEEVHGLGSPLHNHIDIDFGAVDVGVAAWCGLGLFPVSLICCGVVICFGIL